MTNVQKHSSFHGLQLLLFCGGGAFGKVYLCRDISGKEMAVKIISKELLGDAWKRELKGISNYRKITEMTPALLQVFYVAEDEECLFYTMESADSRSSEKYIPDTLSAHLAEGPIPDSEIFEIIFSVFNGIEAIHSAGFAHRDIKPDNILFVDGLAKIGDPGLVSSASKSATSLAGTLDFIPPEVRSGEHPDSNTKKYFQQNDLYAFGKLIYCAVTGLEPQNFPSIPAEMEISLRRKYYLQLSFRLCNRNPIQRMKSLDEVKEELFRIEKRQLQGESFGERLLDKTKELGHVILSGILEPFQIKMSDPAKNKVQTYCHPELKITMQIPAEWSVLTVESVQKYLQTKKSLSEAEEKKAKILESLTQTGPCFIYCDYDKSFPDNCFIESLPIKAADFEIFSNDLLDFLIRKMFKTDMGEQTKIYDIQKMELAGHFCIRTEVSLNPDLCRSIFYLTFCKDHCISIALNCRLNSYAKRKVEFEKAIKTLKFIR